MRRMPIRWRLSLAFALGMAVVLSALGAFLYVRLERSLMGGLDETLEVRATQRRSIDELGPAGRGGHRAAVWPSWPILASSPSGAIRSWSSGRWAVASAGAFTAGTRRRPHAGEAASTGPRCSLVGISLEDTEDAFAAC